MKTQKPFPPPGFKYRHHHMHKPNPDLTIQQPKAGYAVYTAGNQALTVWYSNIVDTIVYKDVTWDTIDAIRTQLRQVRGWYVESQFEGAIAWNFLGVYTNEQ